MKAVKPKRITAKQRVARVKNVAIARSKKKAAAKKSSSGSSKGVYVRKTKMVNGKTVSIDKWFSNAGDAKKYGKLLGKGVSYYEPASTGVTNQWQRG